MKTLLLALSFGLTGAVGAAEPDSLVQELFAVGFSETEALDTLGVRPARLVDSNCVLAQEPLEISVPGLLMTDTVAAHSNSVLPSIPADGVLLIPAGRCFDVRIDRAGARWAWYPCSEGAGTTIHDVMPGGGHHGTASGSVAWSVQDDFHYNLRYGALRCDNLLRGLAYGTSNAFFLDGKSTAPVTNSTELKIVLPEALVTGKVYRISCASKGTFKPKADTNLESVFVYENNLFFETYGKSFTVASATTNFSFIPLGASVANPLVFSDVQLVSLADPVRYVPALSNRTLAANGQALNCLAGAGHNGSETKVQQADLTLPDLYNFWYTNGAALKRGYADFVRETGAQILARKSTEISYAVTELRTHTNDLLNAALRAERDLLGHKTIKVVTGHGQSNWEGKTPGDGYFPEQNFSNCYVAQKFNMTNGSVLGLKAMSKSKCQYPRVQGGCNSGYFLIPLVRDYFREPIVFLTWGWGGNPMTASTNTPLPEFYPNDGTQPPFDPNLEGRGYGWDQVKETVVKPLRVLAERGYYPEHLIHLMSQGAEDRYYDYKAYVWEEKQALFFAKLRGLLHKSDMKAGMYVDPWVGHFSTVIQGAMRSIASNSPDIWVIEINSNVTYNSDNAHYDGHGNELVAHWAFDLMLELNGLPARDGAISNLVPSLVLDTSASLGGALASTGSVFDVYCYWGVKNGGTSPTNWMNTTYVGAFTGAASLVQGPVTGLLAGTNYYFTFLASNTAKTAWGIPSGRLTTPPTTYTPSGVRASWLHGYGITSNLAEAELLDEDGDGIPTWQEYYAGTDPTTNASAFRLLAVGHADGAPVLAWQGSRNGAALNYSLYACTDLVEQDWFLVASNSIPCDPEGTGMNIWTSPLSASSGVYFQPAVLR